MRGLPPIRPAQLQPARIGTAIALAALVGSLAVAGFALFPIHASWAAIRTVGTASHASVAATVWGPPALHYATTGFGSPGAPVSGGAASLASGPTASSYAFSGMGSPSGTLGITGSNSMLMHCAKMFKL